MKERLIKFTIVFFTMLAIGYFLFGDQLYRWVVYNIWHLAFQHGY